MYVSKTGKSDWFTKPMYVLLGSYVSRLYEAESVFYRGKMMNDWLGLEPVLRLVSFAGIFLILFLWEIKSPRRTLGFSKGYRWFNNLSIVLLNSILLRLVFPGAAVGVAVWVEMEQLGLFNNTFLSEWPFWIKVIIGVVLLDFTIWLQHVLFHAVPALWRLHRMHHTDLDIDITTGLRFHPLEIVLSMAIKAGVILMLGVPVAAVLIFEVLLNTTSMFNHGNVNLPRRLDKWLRWIIVTPDMHRVHHSWRSDETDSNFGFNVPWWDRLLGTYRAQPKDGHLEMIIGIKQFRARDDSRLDRLLLQPFVSSHHVTDSESLK